MAPKPSDLAKKAAAGIIPRATMEQLAVGDVDAEGNITVAEYDTEGKLIAELSDEEIAAAVAARDAKLADGVTVGEPQAEMFRTFTDQAVAPIGVPTSDGRMFSSEIDLSFRTCPLPLQWCKQSTYGHDMSYTVGVIESIRREGDQVLASGYMLNSEEGDEACELLAHGVTNPSVDLANADWQYTDKDGKEIEWEDLWDLMDEGGEYFMTFTKAEVIATTLVSTPAFDTRFTLDAERSSREPAMVASVVDSIALKTYDPALFSNPNLLRPTRPTYDQATGRIYGHLAEWGHAVRGTDGRTPPRNTNDYLNFHTGQVMLTNGNQLAVGRLTVQGGHADTLPWVTAATARAHYDNACLAFGLVRVYEDHHGIAFSGVPAPGVDPEIFTQGMTAPLSGDWRDCGQGLDMVAAHAVNSPGLPIYSGTTGPDGRPMSLVASFGPSRQGKRSRTPDVLTAEDLAKAISSGVVQGMAAVEQAKEKERRDRDLAAKIAKARVLATPAVETKKLRTELTSAIDRARKIVPTGK
jgi:hypothetical protein